LLHRCSDVARVVVAAVPCVVWVKRSIKQLSGVHIIGLLSICLSKKS
jgi:hypothetical protein